MNKYLVRISWEVSNTMAIEANNEEEALEKAWQETESTNPNEFEWEVNSEDITDYEE